MSVDNQRILTTEVEVIFRTSPLLFQDSNYLLDSVERSLPNNTQQHTPMTPIRARTQTSRSRFQRGNHSVTVSWVLITTILFCVKLKSYFHIYRNEVYNARIQLAVLDHNLHAKRGMARNSNGHQIYSQRYRKQTKKWDVTPRKEAKNMNTFPS